MITEFQFFLFSTLALVAGLSITRWIHSRYGMDIVVGRHSLSGYEKGEFPLISILVPARNEQRNIRRCVQSLLAQIYPNFELIVVDDRSSDGTVTILEELRSTNQRLRVVQGNELPPGWAGKPHALAQGVIHAQGDWLCFVDADTFAEPELIRSAFLIAQENHVEMFTILTAQELDSFWEKTILPLVFTGLSFGFSAQRVNDPMRSEAVANGQFILIKRNVYDAVGGHITIRDSIVEDKDLAVLVKRGGYRLLIADGREVASTRMYTSLPEIWEGWTKNIYLGLRDRLSLLLFGATLGLLGSLLLPLWLLLGLLWYITTANLLAGFVVLEALGLWGYLIKKRIQVNQSFRISPLYAFTLPIGALVFTAMMVTSAWMVLSGKGVTWKGRRYDRR